MSPPRFYCPQIAVAPKVPEARYFLDAAEAKHATSVLRLRADDVLSLFDGQGGEAQAKVIEARRDKVCVEVIQWREPQIRSSAELTLAIALPKGDRQKTLVDAATELGVARLIPIVCARGVAQPTDSALERLRRQVIEACKQCGRNYAMEITPPVMHSELISMFADGTNLQLVAHPYDVSGTRRHLTSYLSGSVRSSVLAIGPEGGFTDDEVAQLAGADWSVIDLGPLVLRIEIAAIAAVAQVMGWVHGQVMNRAASL